jgi:hypothetical protein
LGVARAQPVGEGGAKAKVDAVHPADEEVGGFEFLLAQVVGPVLAALPVFLSVELGDESGAGVEEVGHPEQPPVRGEDRWVH